MSQPAGSRAPWASRAVTASVGVLAWLTAHHLTFGIVEHTHLVADGHLAAHEHHYAGPVALAAVMTLATGLVAVLLGGLRVPGPAPARVLNHQGWAAHACRPAGAATVLWASLPSSAWK